MQILVRIAGPPEMSPRAEDSSAGHNLTSYRHGDEYSHVSTFAANSPLFRDHLCDAQLPKDRFSRATQPRCLTACPRDLDEPQLLVDSLSQTQRVQQLVDHADTSTPNGLGTLGHLVMHARC
ncbi:hypothetical protein ACFL5O_04970 [Myxococcota bacterium]